MSNEKEEIKKADEKRDHMSEEIDKKISEGESPAEKSTIFEKEKGYILELEDVQKAFGSNEVLKGVDLKVKKTETIVILGKSGTGKSVILKCIIGLIQPDHGVIKVLGEDITTLKGKELENLRRKMGFLFQGGALYDSMTVRDNLKFPLVRMPGNIDEDMDEKVEKVLKEVDLVKAIDKMPSELSGGMQKRIALARTIILEPDIILYDEPTTGLDPATSKEISELILQMQESRGVTSLIVTHDMPCAEIVSNRIEILKDGDFFVEGTFEELRKSDDKFVKGFFEFY